jgi:hypothetical protein
MARKDFVVTTYTIQMYQKAPATWHDIDFVFQGRILCAGDPPLGRPVLFVFGLHPSSPVTPEPQYFVEDDVGATFVPFNDLHNYVDILRNERPVFAALDSDNPNAMRLATTDEPVGEGEAAGVFALR